jgi:FMN-dependent NADH-azoreductase
MTNNKAREVNNPIIKQLIDQTTPEELAKIDIEMTNNKQQWAVDKAKELIDKMTKQYALIAVYEIINVTAGLKGWIDGFQCWEEVKKEIETYDKQ